MGCACRRQTPLIRANNKYYGLNLSNFPQKEIMPFVKYDKVPLIDIANMKKRKGMFMHYCYRKHNKNRACAAKEGEHEGGEGKEGKEGSDAKSNNNDINEKCKSNSDNVIANSISCTKDDGYKYTNTNTITNNNMYSTYCDEYVHSDIPFNNTRAHAHNEQGRLTHGGMN